MGIFTVSQDKEDQLVQRMRLLGVSESDIKESFVRSSGPGGQNVNKVSTCVLLHHLPSGILVKCQKTRSQALNRFYARRILLDRVEKKKTGLIAEENARRAKIRKQKQKRSQRAKKKMLEAKRLQAQKKKHRQAIRPLDADDF